MTGDRHAWTPGRDPVDLRRSVAAAHERFLSSGRPPEGLRTVVRDSWQRCLRVGVDPDRVSPRVDLDGAQLRARRDAHPLTPLLPLFRRLLLDNAPGGHIVALGDADGRLMWVEGDRSLRARAERMHFVEGADWREQAAGTNAPGLALALDQEVQVFASEHFGRNVQPWSCSAVPVRDPDTGAVLGVLDLTGDDAAASPQALALVQATAAAAESELRVRRLRGLAPHPAPPAPRPPGEPEPALLRVLGRRRALLEAGGRTVELSRRHSEILLLLTRDPDGLSGDGLGVRLHERDASPVTVRAEMSRLRRLLGTGVLASRPYRLLAPTGTDADQVRRLLARGEHRAALRAYPGPVLPCSDAPGVIDAREELDAEIRTALVRAGDGEALADWAARPDGRGDPRILQAALRALPPGSPRVPLLRAGLSRLA